MPLAAQEQRQHDQDDAEERGRETAGGIGGAEQGVDERVEMEEEGAVHEGIVRVALAGGELPGKVGVQTLVVVQGPRAKVPEAGQAGGDDDQGVEEELEGHGERRRNDRRGRGRDDVLRGERPAAVAGRGVASGSGLRAVVSRRGAGGGAGRRCRLSHAGVPRCGEYAPRAGGASGEYTTWGDGVMGDRASGFDRVSGCQVPSSFLTPHHPITLSPIAPGFRHPTPFAL